MPRIYQTSLFTPVSTRAQDASTSAVDAAAQALPLRSDMAPVARWPRPAQAYAAADLSPTASFNLVPPKVDAAHVAQRVGCLRPVRQGGLRLKTCLEGDKLVVHNYGHGGAGWTLAPGAVEESIRLYEAARVKNGRCRAPITVLGAGVMGLWTAVALAQRQDAPPITLMAEAWDNLTSHNAGGLLAPVSLQDAPDAQARTLALGKASLHVWQAIARGEVAWARQGARHMPVFVGLDTDSGLDTYVRAGLMPPPRAAEVCFGQCHQHAMRIYDTLFIDVRTMMARLDAALNDLKVTRVTATIADLDAVDATEIFNCTGLGARALCQDARMLPVQGHLLTLQAQPVARLRDYMVYTRVPNLPDMRAADRRNTAQVQPAYLYYMPKGEGVLGGTFIAGAEDKDDHPEAFGGIIGRAQRFFGQP